MSYNDPDGSVYLLGDNLPDAADSDNSELLVVGAPQTWSLSTEGFLVSPSGRYVYAFTPDGGYYVQLATPDSPILEQFSPSAPYKCTAISETSTEQAAVLDCTATTTAGSYDYFTICSDGRVEGDVDGCGGSDAAVLSFFRFTLTAD